MATSPPNEGTRPPISALLWAVAVIGTLAGLGLYLASGARKPDAVDVPPPLGVTGGVADGVPQPTALPPPPANFFTIPGCRLFDAMVATGESEIALAAQCAIPASAKTLAVAVAVVDPYRSGALSVFAADASADSATPLEFESGRPRNGLLYLPLPADGSGRARVRNTASEPVRVILDLSGYFE
jgi:hypothetical protein